MIKILYDSCPSADAESSVIDSISGEGRWFLERMGEDLAVLVVQELDEDDQRIILEASGGLRIATLSITVED